MKILSAGAALNDLLLRESEEFLASLEGEKGGMVLVENSEIDSVLKKSGALLESAPGGSACNTAVGLARLGADSHFIGKRGDDAAGGMMAARMEKWKVNCHYKSSKTPTGQVLSIITPDAQRTMMTYLGASAEFSPDELSEDDFKGFDLLHLEGYVLFNRDLARKILDLAKSAGIKVSLDLSSFEVVRANADILEKIIREDIDILIANEDEAGEYTKKTPEESLDIFASMVDIAVVKLGAEGVLVARGKESLKEKGRKVEAVDTTGAGDLWASGFLYGLSQDWSLSQCAKLGNATGAAVVQVVGASIPDISYREIKKEFSI